MRKFTGYLPAILFTIFYMFAFFSGNGLDMGFVLILLACLWLSAFGLHKGLFWSGIFGAFGAALLVYDGVGKSDYIGFSVGILLILFYFLFGVYLFKNRKYIKKAENKEVAIVFIKMLLTIAVLVASGYLAVVSSLVLESEGINPVISAIGAFVIPTLFLPLIWLKRRKKVLVVWLLLAAVYFAVLGIDYKIVKYDESITVNTSPNIDISQYLPFSEDSKIVKLDSKTLKLTENLPRIDGAAALFPVYSAFVNAVYPPETGLWDGVFVYNNTPEGFRQLAEKNTDIFIGVYPSEEQKAYADECGTTFKYTPIGTEAFVFFVHKDNPIENLTSQQIKDIYSGKITNWKELGGRNEKIAAFQRNEGSGSQSMLERFMGDTPIMQPPTELINDMMSGIIEQVSSYRSKSNSIGFSFRYYVEGIIKNPDIKMLSVDGAAPTAENIKNGKYPIVTPIYAVTYEEQTNENVDKLLDWILSEEGQKIIEETGYVGIVSDF